MTAAAARSSIAFDPAAASWAEDLPAESVLRPADAITVVYLLASGILAAFFLRPAPIGGVLAMMHAGAAVALPFMLRHLAAHPEGWRLILRHWYPMLLFFVFYEETALINAGSPVPYLDPWLARTEALLFGAQLSEVFPAALPWPWFQELMAASYFSYYLMIPLGGLCIWLRSRERFATFLFTVCACFYFCYFVFCTFPAGGPQQYLEGGHIHWDGVLFGPVLTEMLRLLECNTGAFPSSHVAIALIILVFLWRERGPERFVAAAAFGGLFLATVYGGPHYALDLPAGLATGVLFLVLAPRLEQRLR